MRLLPLNAIVEGSYLGKSIYNEYGNVLLRENEILTQSRINNLRLNGFTAVYIRDEYSNEIIEDIIKPEIKSRARLNLVNTFKTISNLDDSKDVNVKRLNQQIKNLSKVAHDIVDELFYEKDLMVNLVDIKSADNYTYMHSLSVGILSLVTAISMGFNKYDLYDISIGALLHDVGKIFIPNEILNKKDKLTKEEFEIVANHPKLGFDYLTKNTNLNLNIRRIVLEHHENEDGKGYPNQKKSNEVHEYSKVVAVADVYDALTSNRPYRYGMLPNQAIEYMMTLSGTKFNCLLIDSFIKKIVPYPVGTIIKLSNNKIGKVIEINKKYPLRPKVQIIKEKFLTNEIIDLLSSKSMNIIIKDVVYNI